MRVTGACTECSCNAIIDAKHQEQLESRSAAERILVDAGGWKENEHMYSVLIAEDEILVRMGLTVSVPWEKMDMYVVQDVSDGQAALECWRKYRPDILITDLAMPGMDGLELIRKIREEDAHAAVVVVTCMEDFEMLHAAMELGVCAYLVKVSMTIEDITQALLKARDSLGSSRDQRRLQVTDAEKREMLSQHIIDGSLSLKGLVENGRKHGWQLPSGVFAARIHMEGTDRLTDVTRRMLEHMCQEYLQDFAPVCFIGEIAADLDVCVVMEKHADSEMICGELNRYLQYIQTHFSVSARAVVSLHQLSLADVSAWFRVARQMLHHPYLFDREIIRAGWQGQVYLEGLESIARKLKLQLLYLPEHSAAAMDALSRTIRLAGQDENAVRHGLEKLAEYAGMTQAPSLQGGLMPALRAVSRALPDAPTVRREVAQVQRYLEEHLADKLRLSHVAAVAHVNPQYLSSIFKQELKIGYSDYVNMLRIQRAGELLEDTECSFQDIAEQCGFSDTAYFCRVFKQRTGMTPSQWRRGER